MACSPEKLQPIDFTNIAWAVQTFRLCIEDTPFWIHLHHLLRGTLPGWRQKEVASLLYSLPESGIQPDAEALENMLDFISISGEAAEDTAPGTVSTYQWAGQTVLFDSTSVRSGDSRPKQPPVPLRFRVNAVVGIALCNHMPSSAALAALERDLSVALPTVRSATHWGAD